MLRNNRMYPSLFWSILLLSSMESQSFTISGSNKITAASTLTYPAETPISTAADPLPTPVATESTGSYSPLVVESQATSIQVEVIKNATTQSSTWATVATEETTHPKIHHLTSSQASVSPPRVGVSPTAKIIQTTASHPLVESSHPYTEQTSPLQTDPAHPHAVDVVQTSQTATPPRTQPDANRTSPKPHFTPSTPAPLTANSKFTSTSQSSPVEVTSLSWKRTANSTATSVTFPSNLTTGSPFTITPGRASSAITTPDSTVDLNSISSSSSPGLSSSTEFNPTTTSAPPTGLPSSSIGPSTTSRPSTTDESSSTTMLISVTSTVSSTTNSTNSSFGILNPRIPKRFSIPTTDDAITIKIKPSSPNNVSPPGGLLPCSPPHRNRLVGQCLIAVASLAGVASIFMVCTIVLCTKLSSRKHLYDMRRAERGTEMVCISALMSEERSSYGRHHPLKMNGALLPQTGDDSDEEGGDNLTLNSFLPENDRSV